MLRTKILSQMARTRNTVLAQCRSLRHIYNDLPLMENITVAQREQADNAIIHVQEQLLQAYEDLQDISTLLGGKTR